MATLTTLRAQLRKDLHDEDSANYRWVDGVLDRHLERAKRELSFELPREQKTTLTTTIGSRDVSLSSLTDLVRIEAVEYPVGEYPPLYVPFSLWASNLTLLVESAPDAVENLYVYWGKVHTVDGSTCTLPVWAEESLLMGAAGYAATELASFTTNRANIAGPGAVEDYAAWGADLLRRFHEDLRKIGSGSRLRLGSLFTPGGEAGRDVVQWQE